MKFKCTHMRKIILSVIYKKSDAKDSGLPHESNVNFRTMKMTKKLIANARYRVLLQKTTHF